MFLNIDLTFFVDEKVFSCRSAKLNIGIIPRAHFFFEMRKKKEKRVSHLATWRKTVAVRFHCNGYRAGRLMWARRIPAGGEVRWYSSEFYTANGFPKFRLRRETDYRNISGHLGRAVGRRPATAGSIALTIVRESHDIPVVFYFCFLHLCSTSGLDRVEFVVGSYYDLAKHDIVIFYDFSYFSHIP